MKSILGLIIILGLIELGLESQFDLQNSIFNLNEDNVDDFIEYAKSSGSSILLNVYSNSCKYSNKFTPMFEQAAKDISAEKEYNVLFARIEGENNPQVLDKFDVKGYPSLYFFTPKENYIPFKYFLNEYSIEEVVKAIKVTVGAPILISSFNQFMQKYEMQKEPFIFGIFKNQNQPLSIFDNFRKSYPTLKIFYSFDFTNFVKKFALSENEATIITLVKNPALYEVPYLVQFNKSLEVKDFIIQNFYSPYDFCSNLTDFINKEKKLPKGVLYLDLDNIPKQNSTKILHAFSLVTKEFMSKIDFCIMNADAKKKKYESMELEPEGTFYIYSNIRKYRLIDQLVKDDTLNQTSLTKFIQNFLEGKIKYYRKSHDFNPDIATVPLKYIRGAEYDEVVADPSKDVYMRISDKMQLFKDERAYISMDAWINLSYEFNINGS